MTTRVVPSNGGFTVAIPPARDNHNLIHVFFFWESITVGVHDENLPSEAYFFVTQIKKARQHSSTHRIDKTSKTYSVTFSGLWPLHGFPVRANMPIRHELHDLI